MQYEIDWDKYDRRLEFWIGNEKWGREFTIRLMPYCPECKGTGGYCGSEIEPPEPCWYCEGNELVSLRRYWAIRLKTWFWESPIGKALAAFEWWAWTPTFDYRDQLDNEWWAQFKR